MCDKDGRTSDWPGRTFSLSEPCGAKTNNSNSVEFPAVGWRDYDSYGTLRGAGTYGGYWSSVANGSNNAYGMYFLSSSLGVSNGFNKQDSRSVRCVR